MRLALPEPTRYDLLARYLATRAGAPLFAWALRLPPERLRFGRWLPTVLTFPGVPERLCDGVAELQDLDQGGVPVAALLEIQTIPDPTMPGRLQVAGGLVWLVLKPNALPGDRYELLALVINLTGVGSAARAYEVGDARWVIKPIEINLAALDAGDFLDRVQQGQAPKELLALLALMRRGDDPVMIQRWRSLVLAEPDRQRRGDCALALVFAEYVGRGELWQQAVEGLTMIESPIIAQLITDTKAETRTATRVETGAEKLLQVLRKRHGSLPEDLAAGIRASTSVEQLDRWFDLALDTESLDQFRQQAGL